MDSLHKENLSFAQLLNSVDFIDNRDKLRYHLKLLEGFIEFNPETKKYYLTYRGRLLVSVMADFRNRIAVEDSRLRYIEQLTLSDHAFAVYTDEDFKRSIVFPFLKIGLARNSAAVYFVSEEKLDSEMLALERHGVLLDGLPTGALTVTSNFEWYLQRGRAEAKTLLTNWTRLLEAKKQARFAGIYAAGEMAIFVDNGLSRELMEYEEALGRQLPVDVCGFCLYSKRLFDEVDAARVFQSHGHVISEELVGKALASAV